VSETLSQPIKIGPGDAHLSSQLCRSVNRKIEVQAGQDINVETLFEK
jgi:hypothetical protein